jgi:hypothetical protein
LRPIRNAYVKHFQCGTASFVPELFVGDARYSGISLGFQVGAAIGERTWYPDSDRHSINARDGRAPAPRVRSIAPKETQAVVLALGYWR